MRRVMCLLCVLLVVACGAPVQVTAQNAAVHVVFSIDERTLGVRSGTVQITDTEGNRIDDAQVTLTAVMTQHGMMNPPLPLSTNGTSYAFTQLNVNMVGEWQMQLRIEGPNLSTTIDIPIVFE